MANLVLLNDIFKEEVSLCIVFGRDKTPLGG